MSRLLQLQSTIRETVVGLARFDRAIADDPDSYSLSLSARSLRNQYNQLQAQFLEEANRIEVDVCSYRLFAMLGGARYTLTEITTALQDFQGLFTTVYRALAARTNKKRDIESPDFGIAYTFPGSLGVVLTLPRERQIFGTGHEYDEAMRAVFGMVRARTAEDIVSYARNVGSGAVRRMDKWAADHANYGFGADIRWKFQTPNPTRVMVQPPEIKNLRNAISLSDYSAPKHISVSGMLWGADLDRKSFHFKTETKQDIKGRFSDAITLDHSVVLPAPYTANLKVTTQSLYATETEEEDYFLLSLEPRKHGESGKEQ